MRRLRIAVVGTGFGARIHVPGLRATGRFDVVALVGQNVARTQEVADRLGVPFACDSLARALDACDLDGISIATPPSSHASLAIAAARAGKHVLCEKPMACSVAEARAMCEAVRGAGVVGRVDFEFRFHPARATLQRMVARGDLGVPQLLVCMDAMPLYVAPYKPPPEWWYDVAAGGGWLGASGSHLLDATRTWLGEARCLTAMVDTLGHGSADDTYALLVRMRSGARAILHQSAAVHGPRAQALRLSGSEGTAWLDEEWGLWRSSRSRSGEAERVALSADLALPEVAVPAHAGPFAARELPSFVRVAEAWSDGISRRQEAEAAPLAATFDDGLACQMLIEAARVASRSGTWVDLET